MHELADDIIATLETAVEEFRGVDEVLNSKEKE